MIESTSCIRISLMLAGFLLSLPLGAAQNNSATGNEVRPYTVSSCPNYPDAPSAVIKASAPDNNSGTVSARAAAPAAKGGLSRAIDRKYLLVMGAMFAASIVDVEKTNTCLEQRTCSFVPAPLRSRAALYGIGLPVDAGIAYIGYRLKAGRDRWWFVPGLGVSAVNAYVAYHSAQEPSYHSAKAAVDPARTTFSPR